MRPILTIVLFLKLGLVLGQPVNYFVPPEILKVGKTMSSFVPNGWTIVDSTKGDLNGDHNLDIAFVIESKDSLITYSFSEFEGEQRVNRMYTEKYPRSILIIAFSNSTKDSLNLIEQSNSMIHARIGLNTKIEIENNLLKIEYNSSSSAYNHSSNSNYYFSYQNKQFLLNKFDSFRQDYEWTENCIIDFISKIFVLTKGKVNAGKPATVWKNIDDIEPKTMTEFKEPGYWYIAEGIMI
ncbi:hypothetical protein QWY90_08315 [Flavobacterium paronense]|uniref:VCBS repeat-containing protein n=1 Tax=Flavobacterium paronense TaxID=1392775 RepID=A0ABV5GA48_9FLAO|nr:hypothetical protein [Flavobacterium paronense]MDN3677318.1 hypothetical protein [Flavobacterium paronense]